MVKRRRFMLAALLVFLCLGPAGAVSQEPDKSAFPLKAKMTGQFTSGLYALYLSADPSVVWKPGLLAIGVGTELIIGLSQFDMYVLPYLRAEVGWLHIDFGYALPLVRPLEGDGLAGLSVGFGIALEPFKVGYGRLGIDSGLDFSFVEFSKAYDRFADTYAAEQIVIAMALSSRFGFGVTYSFTLL